MNERYKVQQQLELITANKTDNLMALKLLYESNYSKVKSLVLWNNSTKENAKNNYQKFYLVVWNNVTKYLSFSVNKNAILEYYIT
ncbi:hypothetical protein [Mariniflexile sp.]|uniref:hypothetical protein n=1 Tax=Mariniflexile sp. TaxID=1979402 RepID=UPI003566BED8